MANIKDLVPESHHDLLDAAWATATATLDEGLVTAGKIGTKDDADVTSYDQPGDQRYSVVFEPRKVVANG